MIRSLSAVVVVSALIAASAAITVLAGSPAPQTFGTGWSQATLTPVESTFFTYQIPTNQASGVMHHFWITGAPGCVDTSIWNYYVDGESNASVSFTPSLAAGTGFDDQSAPWANSYFGKQAKTGGFFNNWRVPFGKSILITGSTVNQQTCEFYVILRGTENMQFSVGGYRVPNAARLSLHRIENQPYKALDLVTIAAVPSGRSGFVLGHTLAVTSPNMNFLEGCYHMYTGAQDPVANYPGTIIATGTEDYFTSAYYFDGGQFRSEISGETHITTDTTGLVNFSAYRLHDSDPLFFRDGLNFQWRVGDVDDPSTGLKCTKISGVPHGSPQASNVTSYAWVYSWPSDQH